MTRRWIDGVAGALAYAARVYYTVRSVRDMPDGPACVGVGASNKPRVVTGVRAGLCCLGCCAGVLVCQVVLGLMNPLVMIGAMLVILSERVVPWHRQLSQVVGALAMLGGVGLLFRSL